MICASNGLLRWNLSDIFIDLWISPSANVSMNPISCLAKFSLWFHMLGFDWFFRIFLWIARGLRRQKVHPQKGLPHHHFSTLCSTSRRRSWRSIYFSRAHSRQGGKGLLLHFPMSIAGMEHVFSLVIVRICFLRHKVPLRHGILSLLAMFATRSG